MWIIIPILALSIPIVAIISGGPIGQAIAEAIREKSSGGIKTDQKIILSLESRISELENTLSAFSEDVHRLEEKNSFFERLIKDDTKIT